MLMLTLTLTLVEGLRSLLGVRIGDQVRRLVTRTRERSQEAPRPRAHPSLPPDMTMVPVPSYPTLSTVLGASPVSLTAISTGGEPAQSAAAILPTAANPPSQCLLSHHPLTFLLPLVHASTAQVAVPPLPVTNGLRSRLSHHNTRIQRYITIPPKYASTAVRPNTPSSCYPVDH